MTTKLAFAIAIAIALAFTSAAAAQRRQGDLRTSVEDFVIRGNPCLKADGTELGLLEIDIRGPRGAVTVSAVRRGTDTPVDNLSISQIANCDPNIPEYYELKGNLPAYPGHNGSYSRVRVRIIVLGLDLKTDRIDGENVPREKAWALVTVVRRSDVDPEKWVDDTFLPPMVVELERLRQAARN